MTKYRLAVDVRTRVQMISGLANAHGLQDPEPDDGPRLGRLCNWVASDRIIASQGLRISRYRRLWQSKRTQPRGRVEPLGEDASAANLGFTDAPSNASVRGAMTSAAAQRSRLAVWSERLQDHGVALLCCVVALVYLPSLAGGYLPYDDDWLIERNPLLEAPLGEALPAIAFDLSPRTRLILGAEYLPLRDLSHWCEVAVFGKVALGMRLVQLGLYLGALRLLHGALARRLPQLVALVAVTCVALHPTHVESVAWLAGRKDVLAMLFIGGALNCYTREGKGRWWTVLFVMAAALSKSMSVICPGLLLATDLLTGRRPAWQVIAASMVGVGVVFAVHRAVGASVAMVGGPLEHSRAVAFWTMGEVWLRYVTALIYPPSLSIIYDVAPVPHVTTRSVLGWSLLLGTLGYAALRAVNGKTFALGIALWAWLPLLPVSQVWVPLQNVMADRYLWLTSVALGLLFGVACERPGVDRTSPRAVWIGSWTVKVSSAAFLVVFTLGTAERAALFSDPVALFDDASSKSFGPRAPYQLGYALGLRGESAAAVDAYREALSRECNACAALRNAANNLALLLVSRGEPQLAEPVLRQSVERFPDDPKTLFNLVKVLARTGKEDEARRLFELGRARFPEYLETSESGARSRDTCTSH